MSHELIAPLVERLGWTLIHSLWQFAAIASLLCIVLRLLKERSAKARYISACIALFAMIVVAASTFGVIDPVAELSLATMEGRTPLGETGGAGARNERDSRFHKLAETQVPLSGGESFEHKDAPASAGAEAHSDADSAVESLSGPFGRPFVGQLASTFAELNRDVVDRVARWQNTLIIGWLVGVVLLSTRPLVGWRSARNLRTHGLEDVPTEVSEMVARIARRLGISRPVIAMQSPLVDVPTLIGALRPLILMPASALTGLPREQLEAVIAHELAHVRRHDYAINSIQVLLETLFFYHPAVWWVSHRIRIEREDCCDDTAVALTGDRAGYARMLVALDERRGPRAAARPAVSSVGGSLRARVRRILGLSAHNRRPDSAGVLLALGSVAAALLISAMWLSATAGAQSAAGDHPAGDQPAQRVLFPDGVKQVEMPSDEPGADVSLALDKPEYFLGENVVLHWRIRNAGDQPIEFDFGGDGRTPADRGWYSF